MAIDPDRLLALAIPDETQTYGPRDAILYALGLGLGLDPADEAALAFVYEPHLKVLPTFAAALAFPAFWVRDLPTGIDFTQIVHGEESLRLHRPLAPQAQVIGRARVADVVDKGLGKGAIVTIERQILDASDGMLVATSRQSIFCRADGGFGGPRRPSPPAPPLPGRAPDRVRDLPTSPQTALIYRLSGDGNPLHADPATARAAGFRGPILHGLATFGIAGYAILTTFCGHDPARLGALACRFTAPVFPGETIRTEMWREGGVVRFQARVAERDAIALAQGRAEIRE